MTISINYSNTQFQFPELMKIISKSPQSTIIVLDNELKANTQAFMSTIGGRNHRHILLVLMSSKYAELSDMPFVHPIHPGLTAVIPREAT